MIKPNDCYCCKCVCVCSALSTLFNLVFMFKASWLLNGKYFFFIFNCMHMNWKHCIGSKWDFWGSKRALQNNETVANLVNRNRAAVIYSHSFIQRTHLEKSNKGGRKAKIVRSIQTGFEYFCCFALRNIVHFSISIAQEISTLEAKWIIISHEDRYHEWWESRHLGHEWINFSLVLSAK